MTTLPPLRVYGALAAAQTARGWSVGLRRRSRSTSQHNRRVWVACRRCVDVGEAEVAADVAAMGSRQFRRVASPEVWVGPTAHVLPELLGRTIIAQMKKATPAEMGTTEVGSVLLSLGLPDDWPSAATFLFGEFALEDGLLQIGSFIPGTIGAELVRRVGDDALLVDAITSPQIELLADARIIVTIMWSGSRFSTFRIDGTDLLGHDVAKIIVGHPTSTDRGTDYSAANEKAKNDRYHGLRGSQVNSSRTGGGRDFMRTALADEVRQIEDLIGFLSDGREHHLAGLAARVRLLVHGGRNRTYGLLQHCAGFDRLPLIVFADRHPETPPPLDDALVFHPIGAATADPVFLNPVDLDLWLKMPAITIGSQSFSHLAVIKEIGDTIGAHRDDGIGPLAHALQMVRTGGSQKHRNVEIYIVEVATILLQLARLVLEQSTPTSQHT